MHTIRNRWDTLLRRRTFWIAFASCVVLIYAMPLPVVHAKTLSIADDNTVHICIIHVFDQPVNTAANHVSQPGISQPTITYSITVQTTTYAVRFQDCAGNVLHDGWQTRLFDTYQAGMAKVEVYYPPCDNAQDEGSRTCYRRHGDLLVEAGRSYRYQGRYQQALERYWLAFIFRNKADWPNGEAAALNNMGVVYRLLGDYGQALALYQQALLMLQDIDSLRPQHTVLHGMGVVYARQGNYAQAETAFARSLAIKDAVGAEAHKGVTLNSLGLLYLRQGRYDLAVQTLEQALAIARQFEERALERIVLTSIGVIYNRQGRFGKAVATFQQALVVESSTPNRSSRSVILGNMADSYLQQGRLAEALELQESALAIMQDLGEAGQIAIIQNSIGVIHAKQNNPTTALTFLRESVETLNEIGEPVTAARVLDNMGVVYQQLSQFSQALESHRAALTVFQSVADRANEGRTLQSMGTLYRLTGDYQESLSAYRQSLRLYQDVGDQVGEGEVFDGLGAVYEDLARPTVALAYYHRAMRILESVRAIAGSESGRATYIAQYVDLYDRAVGLTLQQNQPEAAFMISERGRARSFLDSMSTGYVELSDDATTDLLQQENELFRVRKSIRDALTSAQQSNPPDDNLVADLETQLAEAEVAYAAALAAIERRADQLVTLVPDRQQRLELHEIRQQLDEHTTLLSYWMLGNRTVAFVFTADTFDVVELSDATPEAVVSAVESLYDWINLDNRHPLPAQQLYDWLVAPLIDRVHTSHIAIVPHQQLHYVPFAGLSDGDSYLGEQFTLSILPSATALQYLQENAQNAQAAYYTDVLIFGNPTSNLPSLAYAGSEAQAVGSIFETDIYTTTLATEEELRRNTQNISVLHLAAHGEYNPVNALYSAIVLAAGGEHDGLLEAWEIFSLPLTGTDLVTLSACETNVGELSRGDELVGLTRAFFFAGTPTVLSSLWQVDDAATETLMVSFYRHWKQEGKSKAAALQAAQADVCTDPRWTSPFYWAGFVLNGDAGRATNAPED